MFEESDNRIFVPLTYVGDHTGNERNAESQDDSMQGFGVLEPAALQPEGPVQPMELRRTV